MIEKNNIYNMDCIEGMKQMEENSVDSIVTDPPYGLEFMGKDWDKLGVKVKDKRLVNEAKDVMGFQDGKGGNPYSRSRHRFGQGEGTGTVMQQWHHNWAVQALRVLKPGGYLLAFGGTRTCHRLTCAIEDAGFEIRDMIAWVYGSGFPKSLNIGKQIDKIQGNEREVVGEESIGTYKSMSRIRVEQGYRENLTKCSNKIDITKGNSEWEGWGTALKPALEPITVARKPFKGTVTNNVLKHGTGGINIDESRVGTDETISNHSRNSESAISKGKYGDSKAQETHQTIGQQQGRFPANLIHDGSEEVLKLFPESDGQCGSLRGHDKNRQSPHGIFGKFPPANDCEPRNDSGSAARFFYCAKASKDDRDGGLEGFDEKAMCDLNKIGGSKCTMKTGSGNERNVLKRNNHPTVKPLDLMSYLCKLVTRPKGLILDPFAGSGSTCKAAKKWGFDFIGFEIDSEYCKIAEMRIKSIPNRIDKFV